MTADQKAVAAKIEAWIAAGRNPGVAHWHGALDATMASLEPHLKPGHLIPVQALDNTSTMLLCRRPGRQPRMLCAEISKEAWKPGADLFEEGALLGNYEYDSRADCIHDLAKLIRTHLWRKEKWSSNHYLDYTLNWFTRLVDTGRRDTPVQPDHSYVHTPVLLNLDRVAAIFKLVFAMAARQLQETEPDPAEQSDPAVAPDTGAAENRRHYLEGRLLNLLNCLRDSKAVDFNTFTPRESEQFKRAFAETLARLDPLLDGSR